MKIRRPLAYVATALIAIGGIGALLVACASGGARKAGNEHVPEPSKAVDLDRYLGHWHEFAHYENRFERSCEAVTANYAKREDGLISVINGCHQGGLSRPYRTVEGRAKIVPGSNGTKPKVSFFGPFYVGDYWILDHADDYAWSIVGEPTRRHLWILMRDKKPSELCRTLIERTRAGIRRHAAARDAASVGPNTLINRRSLRKSGARIPSRAETALPRAAGSS